MFSARAPQISIYITGIKTQLHKGKDLGYSTDCQPGVVLYKKVELGQQFCSCIHFVVVSFNILICILSIFVVVYLELVEASNIRSHLHFVVYICWGSWNIHKISVAFCGSSRLDQEQFVVCNPANIHILHCQYTICNWTRCHCLTCNWTRCQCLTYN